MYYTGFYRILPSADFKYELGVGYSVELFLTTIPMLFCQVFNNSATEGKLKPVQSMALLMKLLSLLILIVELLMLIWEIKKTYDMRKLGIAKKKLTEEERRTKYAKKMSYLAFGSMTFFIIVLLIATVASSMRVCPEGQAMESAVCIDCVDVGCKSCPRDSRNCEECSERQALESGRCIDCAQDSCLTCAEDSKVCTECAVGYVLNEQGQCIDCDGKEYVQCEECSLDGKCSKCAIGHRLDEIDKVCIPCNDDSCEACTVTECNTCRDGTRLESG